MMLKGKITEKATELLKLLRGIPPDLRKLRAELETGNYSMEDISMAGTRFVTVDCLDEQFSDMDDEDLRFEKHRFSEPVLLPNQHSTYLYEIMELLLEFGFDPNAVFDGDNAMFWLPLVDNEYVGADTLNLLLEHGGNPNLIVDNESVFEALDFAVIFDAFNQEDRRKYDAAVHCWFVYLGHGAKTKKEELPVTVFENSAMYRDYGWDKFKISDLKDHRNFDFCLTYVEGRGEKWSMHIYDKRTRWEVARL